MESTLIPVDPALPPAPTIGGKRNLAKRLVERIQAIPHTLYAEPFVGMGGVFLRRTMKPPCEAINDLDGDVANLFRVLQRHYVPFMEMIRYQLTARREFERLAQTRAETLTDLERAARFLYLQRTGFGGQRKRRSFGVNYTTGQRFDVTKLAPVLEELHTRLSGVLIEQLPWADFIKRYDRPGTLFYLDPPYFGSEDDYGEAMFAREDFEAMAAQLAAIKGRFILSLNDVPEIRETFSAFKVEAVQTTWSAAGGKHQKNVGELIIEGGS